MSAVGVDRLKITTPDYVSSGNYATGGMWQDFVLATWSVNTLDHNNNGNTLTDAHAFIYLNAATQAFALTVPSAVNRKGKWFWLKKTDGTANAITLNRSLSETLAEATSIVISDKNPILLVSDGANWIAHGIMPSRFVLNDKVNNFGNFYQLLGQIAAASVPTPSAGTLALFQDTDGVLKVKKADGSVVDLEAQGGGGGGTANWNPRTFTNANATSVQWGDAIKMSITTSTNRSVPLPTAVGNSGKRLLIHRTGSGSGVVDVDGSGSQTINSDSNVYLQGDPETLVIYSDGANYIVESWV